MPLSYVISLKNPQPSSVPVEPEPEGQLVEPQDGHLGALLWLKTPAKGVHAGICLEVTPDKAKGVFVVMFYLFFSK